MWGWSVSCGGVGWGGNKVGDGWGAINWGCGLGWVMGSGEVIVGIV